MAGNTTLGEEFAVLQEDMRVWQTVRSLLLIAAAIFAVLVVAAYLVGKLFSARTTRRAIMVGTIVVYSLAFACYFGFITLVMSGNVN